MPKYSKWRQIRARLSAPGNPPRAGVARRTPAAALNRQSRLGSARGAALATATLVLFLGVLAHGLRRGGGYGAGQVATASAQRGEFLVVVRARGSLIAQRSVPIIAPRIHNLTIVWMAAPGSHLNAGDLVVKFDPSSAQQDLGEKMTSVQQAQATVDQAKAQATIIAEQDKLDLATDQTNVESAKLNGIKQSILGVIAGEEAQIDLQTAQEALRVEQAKINLDEKSSEAKIASAQRELQKAQFDANLDRTYLAHMQMRTPIAGVVTYMMNHSQGWMNAQPFKVGDSLWPGATIAEVPDLSTLQMEGDLEEVDRGRVRDGEPVRVHLDALPEATFTGDLDSISPLAEASMDGGFPPKQSFHAYGKLAHVDPRLRPGMNGTLDIVVQRLADAISIPSQALFTRDGRPVVYVETGGNFQPVPVKVLARNPDAVAVSGLPAGAHVALVDPTRTRATGRKAAQ